MPNTLRKPINYKRAPSTIDVARRAGVSQTTVSFVLNAGTRSKVADETAKRVLDAIEELGYRPNKLARSLVHGRTQTVGLVLPYLASDYHAEIVYGMRDTLLEHGYHLLFMNAEPGSQTEEVAIEFLLQQRVDAMLCFVNAKTRNIMPQWLDTLERAETPAVVIDCPFFADAVDTVVSDDVAGMRSAVDHLYELGHRVIGYIMDDSPADYLPLRSKAYFDRCAELALSTDNVIVYSTYSAPREPGAVAREMLSVLARPNPPTAFIGFTDYVFEDFLRLAPETRPAIPGRLSLVGFADTHLARFTNLTSVSQSPRAIGEAAAQRLLERLSNPSLPVTKIDVATKLIVRGSTAPPAE